MSTYARYLIAKGNVFAPSSVAVAKLVQRLREEKWIVAPGAPELAKLELAGPREAKARATGGYAVRTVANTFGEDTRAGLAAGAEALPAELDKEWLDDEGREELRMVWPCSEALGVRVPLTGAGGGTWSLELHRATDFVVPTADTIGALDCTCNCKEDLAFEWDPEEVVPAFANASGIFTECEECSRTFDPSKRMAKVKDPVDGTSDDLPGGAAYRFALVVTTTAVPPKGTKVALVPELVALLEKDFGRGFDQVAVVV